MPPPQTRRGRRPNHNKLQPQPQQQPQQQRQSSSGHAGLVAGHWPSGSAATSLRGSKPEWWLTTMIFLNSVLLVRAGHAEHGATSWRACWLAKAGGRRTSTRERPQRGQGAGSQERKPGISTSRARAILTRARADGAAGACQYLFVVISARGFGGSSGEDGAFVQRSPTTASGCATAAAAAAAAASRSASSTAPSCSRASAASASCAALSSAGAARSR